MTQTNYVPFDALDDLHDGPDSVPQTFLDHLLVIVRGLPVEFSLRDVYRNRENLERQFPDNNEIESAIRGGLQTLRDADLVEFTDNRGHYRRRRASDPSRRTAA